MCHSPSSSELYKSLTHILLGWILIIYVAHLVITYGPKTDNYYIIYHKSGSVESVGQILNEQKYKCGTQFYIF